MNFVARGGKNLFLAGTIDLESEIFYEVKLFAQKPIIDFSRHSANCNQFFEPIYKSISIKICFTRNILDVNLKYFLESPKFFATNIPIHFASLFVPVILVQRLL